MDRWIVVDNTDSGLTYSGSWSTVSGAPYDPHGNFGRTYLTTLQSLTSGQGSISYTFRGSSGRVYATNNIVERNGNIDPTWECALDGRSLQMPNSFPYAENNWILCEWSGVSDGTHTITITARSSGQAFLFDYFIYTPSTGQTRQNVVTGVSWRDSSAQYGAGWDSFGGAGYQGKEPGATLTFPFYGTGITFMGLTPIEPPPGESQAEYFIDHQSPTRFTVPGRSSTTEFHRIFFRTGSVSLGHHTLTVVYRGQTSLMPLVFGHLLIQGSTFPAPERSSNNNNGGGGGDGSGTGTNGPGARTSSGTGSPSPTGNSSPSIGNSNGTFGGLPDPNSPLSNTSGIIVVATTTAADGSVMTTTVRSLAGSGTSTSAIAGQSPATSAPGSWGSVGGDNTIFLGSGSEPSKSSIGAIIGGVLGGMALLALFSLAILKHRASTKRKRNQHDILSEKGHIQPFNAMNNRGSVPGDSPSIAELGGNSLNPDLNAHYQGGKGAIVTAGGYAIHPGRSPNPWDLTPSNDSFSVDENPGEVVQQQQINILPRSKHEEAQRDAQGWSSNQMIIHSDSGYRVPAPAPPANPLTSEYPPLYTAS